MTRAQLKKEKDRITEEWYRVANNFAPIEGARYSWILDYAKYRLDWAIEKTRYVEEKSQDLLKLILIISAGSWAVFSVLLTRNLQIGMWAATFAVLALCCLAVSGYFCVQALSPVDHVYPQGEDKAIEYANFYKNEDVAKGVLALMLGDSSEQERFLTNEKGALINNSARCAFGAVIAFSLSLFAQLLLP